MKSNWMLHGLALCVFFWWWSDWQSVYLARELATTFAVALAVVWLLLAWLAARPQWLEVGSQSQLLALLPKVKLGVQLAVVLLALVTLEFLTSRALMPMHEEVATLEREMCSTSGAGRLKGVGFSREMDGQRMCLRWHTGQIGAVERLSLDEWPALRGLQIGEQLQVRVRRQDSWLWGQGAWYQVAH